MSLSTHERFLFDLNGYLIVRNVFTKDEVAAANAAIDAHAVDLQARDAAALRNAKSDTPLAAVGPRRDMGGMLWWPKPHCDVFRSVLAHPKLVPYLTAFCGEGYRMDHQPLVIAQEADSEGFSLHGGPLNSDGSFNPELQYRCDGRGIWTSLLALSVQLCDHSPSDGGFCVVRGSHKLTLPVPPDVAAGTADCFGELIHQPVTKAGDVVIWSEATVHGATPWRGEQQRRIALYRFAPPNMGYGRGYIDVTAAQLEGMSDLERAVLEPPYATRLERPLVTASDVSEASAGPPSKKPRNEAKKEHDRKLFGTAYF